MTNTLYKAITCQSPATAHKNEIINELVKPSQALLSTSLIRIHQTMLETGSVPKFCPWKAVDVHTSLSERYTQCYYAQASETYRSYLAIMSEKFKKFVTLSEMDDFTRKTLYRINKYQLWYAKVASLMWVKIDGVYLPSNKKEKNAIEIPIDPSILKLARRIMEKLRKFVHLPNLKRVRTFKLDAKIANLEKGDNSFDYWLRISTHQKGKRLLLPIKNSSYLQKEIKKGKLLKFVQLSVTDDGIIIRPIVEQPTAPMRTKGETIGVDWGMTHLFTSSRGDFFGQQFLAKLRVLDQLITTLDSELQKEGISRKKQPQHKRLQQKIKSMVKNEINRMLNRIAEDDIREIAVEKLNFAGGGLSRKMNRLLTRTGRGAIRKKLARLTETRGITITEVPAPYTSQQCHRCYYTNEKNRKTQSQFECLSCGYKTNADLNASFNIRDHRVVLNELRNAGLKPGYSRKTISVNLNKLHDLKFGSINGRE